LSRVRDREPEFELEPEPEINIYAVDRDIPFFGME
jgi:hypothetical protein